MSRRRLLTSLLIFAAALVLVAGAVEAWAQGILDTKHNLAAGVGQSPTGDIKTSGTSEVCVFCHTPHGADASVKAPLWNRAVNTTGYTMYSSQTFDATAEGVPVGVSLACLSCHDGTIAFDALRNLPGPGGFSASPSKDGVTAWTFTNSPDKKMPAGRVTNLGQDLSNDHPISMGYSSARSPSSTSLTNDFATGFYDPPKNSLPLYEGRVECGSCHDPHRADTQTFLRVSNSGSALCLSCHRKDE
ncbi:MAG: cytochrome c3 family protein [Candidatus Methylomirabilia bacterium]